MTLWNINQGLELSINRGLYWVWINDLSRVLIMHTNHTY